MPEIVPPEEIQTIVDKTASFVAKLGEEFEKRIFENEKDNPKFSFLKFNDQYFPWYQKRIRDFRIELGLEKAPAVAPTTAPVEQKRPQPVPAQPTATTGTSATASTAVPQSVFVGAVEGGARLESEEVVRELPQHAPTTLGQRALALARRNKAKAIEVPPPEQFTQELPDGLTGLDVEVIKMTAQFVAKNGHQFQIGLLNREHRNPMFDFLKQNHTSHNYFLGLVEAYTRCLLPARGFPARLRMEYKDRQAVLDRVIAKHQYEKQVEKAKQAEEKKKEQETLANAMIDWHDFVVVETIDFFEEEELPIVQIDTQAPVETMIDSEDMEMEVDEPQTKQPEIKIKRDYVKPEQPSPPAQVRLAAPGLRAPLAPPPGVTPPPGFALPSGEPVAKRMKVEDQVVPEEEFIAKNPSPVTISVELPKDDDKPEWNLRGQTLPVQCNVQETVQQIKDKVAQLIGMPANKQKFKSSQFPVLKDTSTLAFYNVGNGAVLSLSVRARGGKK